MPGQEPHYRSLEVTKKARRVTILMYALTRRLPDYERFGLASQLQRAAVSIGANIAEGYGLGSPGGRSRHLKIARGSAMEIDFLLVVALEVHTECLIDDASLQEILDETHQISKMLSALIRRAEGQR